jgi:general secretion pathway protein A
MSYYKLLGLEKEPFSTSPDPAFLFLSKEHKAAFLRLQISVSLRRGLCVLLGDVGTGKTTLSRKLSQAFMNDQDIVFKMILNPYFETGKEFLAKLASLFGVEISKEASSMEHIEAIERYLFHRGVEDNKTIVLLIDEAQILPDHVLEALRILLNYETNEYKILQLILVGQLELLPRISRMNNFWDRIALKYVLNPLDEEEVREVVKYRLAQAGFHGARPLFTESAMQLIWKHTQGYPRKLSLLCHNCLESLVMNDRSVVDEETVRLLLDKDLRQDLPVDDVFQGLPILRTGAETMDSTVAKVVAMTTPR